MTETDDQPKAKDRFPDAANSLTRLRSFVQSPPHELPTFEAELRSLHTAIRREKFRAIPAITSEVMDQLEKDGDIETVPHADKLVTLMKSVHFPGTDIQLLDGSGVFFSIEQSTGKMYSLTIPGPILEKTGIDEHGQEVLDFPGGLHDYAINKALSVAALEELGSHSGLSNTEDATYLQETTEAPGIHMGGAVYQGQDGQKWYTGVSGAEMTPEALAKLRGMLPENAQADEYTFAGAIDELVAGWVTRMIAGEEITPEQAQSEVEMLINDYMIVEARFNKVPDQVH